MKIEPNNYIPRLLTRPDRSFFLFGPRGTGKSTMLRQVLPEAIHLDLLDASLYLELSRDAHRLEAIIGDRPKGAWIVLDEIQKTPALLDEVHRLMESRHWRFALVREDPEVAIEILAAYMNTYLKEEVREEGLVRRVPPLVRFLSLAGQLNGQVVNMQNIAREAAVSRSTMDTYFSILLDTLLGHFLPAWHPGLKVRRLIPSSIGWGWLGPRWAGCVIPLIGSGREPLWKSLFIMNYEFTTKSAESFGLYITILRKGIIRTFLLLPLPAGEGWGGGSKIK